ncbi:MAG: DUF4834 family protein [Cryomorphaceae bacterium]|nr:DUF4834 family protein [Cryomorphaceae bacterium]
MLKVLLILFIVIYLIIVMVNVFVKPFKEGYKRDGEHSASSSSNGRLIITHNPEKGRRNKKGDPDDYVDYEEVK